MATVDGKTPKALPTRYVLIAEDDPPTRDLLKLIVSEELHLPAQVAEDGLQALDAILLPERIPMLLILDLTLPHLSGEEVVREVQRAHGFKPPVLLISALARGDVSAAARRIGAYAYLSKPFELPDLLQQIQVGLELAGGSEPPNRRVTVRARAPRRQQRMARAP